MSYAQLLATPEWQSRRGEILSRKQFCDDCGRASWHVKLEIHHLYYTLGMMPWEYPDSALVPLCRECHQKRHGIKKPILRKRNGDIIMHSPICLRCDGAGYIPPFRHVQGGVCFRCWGSGYNLDLAEQGNPNA
jgi:hypothetical protein